MAIRHKDPFCSRPCAEKHYGTYETGSGRPYNQIMIRAGSKSPLRLPKPKQKGGTP